MRDRSVCQKKIKGENFIETYGINNGSTLYQHACLVIKRDKKENVSNNYHV